MKMESLVTLNSGRNGRDKIFRAAQYALKLVNAFQVNNRLRACSVVLMVLVQYVYCSSYSCKAIPDVRPIFARSVDINKRSSE